MPWHLRCPRGTPVNAHRLHAAEFPWFASSVDTAELTARLVGRLSGLPPPTSPGYMPLVISQRYAVGDAADRLADLLADHVLLAA